MNFVLPPCISEAHFQGVNGLDLPEFDENDAMSARKMKVSAVILE